MLESKLFKALDTIKTEEWKPLRSFLAGIVGVENDVYRLYVYIYVSRRNLRNRKFQVDRAKDALCPHLSRKSFQNIMSMLLHEIEAYWIWVDLRSDKQRWDLHKLEALNNRALYHEADKVLAKITSTATDDSFLDLWKNYYLLKACHVVFFSNNPIKSKRPEGRNTLSMAVTSSISLVTNLISYYEAEIYNRMQLNHESWDDRLKQVGGLKLLRQNSLLSKSLEVQTKLVRQRALSDPEFLMDLIRDPDVNISHDLKLTYYYRIRTTMILKARTGEGKAMRELKEFIFWSLDSGLFISHGGLYINRFYGDLNVLCALNQNKVARQYILKFSPRLHPSLRKEGMSLGEMIVNFADELYDDVISAYSHVTFRAPDHKLQAAGLFMRSSYELYGPDVLYFESHLRNLSSFISRNKLQLSSFQIDGWKNFLRIFRMIIKKSKFEMINHAIKESPNIIHRRWIEDKIKSGVVS